MASPTYEIAEISSESKCITQTSSKSVSPLATAYPNEAEMEKLIRPDLNPTGDFYKPIVFELSSLR